MVKSAREALAFDADLAPLQALLVAYAPARQRAWHRLCWALDRRLADVIRRGGEPTIAAIRLAWWDAVLVEGDRSKGGGEPLVEAWRAAAPANAAPLAEQLIDGWRTLLGAEALTTADLTRFAQERGGALYRLIARADPSDAPEPLASAGAAWALWDLAGHSADAALTSAAMTQARALLAAGSALPRGAAPKPLRMLHTLAAADIRADHVPQRGFEPRHYRALLWRMLLP